MIKRKHFIKFLIVSILSLHLATEANSGTANDKINSRSFVTQTSSQNKFRTNQNNDTKDTPTDDSQEGMADLLIGSKTTSLMFDDQAISNIERAVESYRNKQSFTLEDSQNKDTMTDNLADNKEKPSEEDLNHNAYIHLASIIYHSPKDWAVWINNKKITSETNIKSEEKELIIKSIDQNQVAIQWNVSPSKLKVLIGDKADSTQYKMNDAGKIEIKFSLKPNQTFAVGSNTVIEGSGPTDSILQNSNNTSTTKATQSTKTTTTPKNNIEKTTIISSSTNRASSSNNNSISFNREKGKSR